MTWEPESRAPKASLGECQQLQGRGWRKAAKDGEKGQPERSLENRDWNRTDHIGRASGRKDG